MERITRNLALKRIEEMPHVNLMPHTTVKQFFPENVGMEQEGGGMSFIPFQTVILASGMECVSGSDEEILKSVSKIEIIGDANNVQDLFTATSAGYQIAQNY